MIPSPLLAWRRQFEALASRLDALDLYVMERLREADADARVQAWLAAQAGPLFGALGVFPIRAYRRLDRSWEPQEAPCGTWCLGYPVLAAESVPTRVEFGFPPLVTAWRDRHGVVDVLAIDVDGENPVSSRTGAFGGVLGLHMMALGADPRPLRVFRDPVAWLRGALTCDPDAPEPVCLAWPDAPDARDVLLFAPELVADDDDHAEALERQVRKLRQAFLPPKPRILVDDSAEKAAA